MIPFIKGVKILKQDINGLIALYKPTSILSHPKDIQDTTSHSIIKGVYDFNEECYSIHPVANDGVVQSVSKVWLINRLDLATSGIVLAATNQAVSDAVKEELRMRRVHKSYTALVFNNVPYASQQKLQQPFRWVDDISISKNGNSIRTKGSNNTSASNIVTAETNVCIKSRQTRDDTWDKKNGHPALMELELEPLTGYSHQLRYQAAKQGYPIVGDPNYGDFRGNKNFKANFENHPLNYLTLEQLEDRAEHEKYLGTKKIIRRNYFNRLFLHARKTELSYVLNGKKFAFSVECPVSRVFGVAYRGTRQPR